MRNLSKLQKAIVLQVFVLSLLILVCFLAGIIINTTPSLPMGIWRVDNTAPILNPSLRGRIVTFCPPDTELFRAAKEQGILRVGRCRGAYTPLLKEVMGVPGDVIEYSDGFLINGHRIPRSKILSLSQAVTRPFTGQLIVPQGKIWIMSSFSALSFDSRYFGLVSVNSLENIVTPFWIW